VAATAPLMHSKPVNEKKLGAEEATPMPTGTEI